MGELPKPSQSSLSLILRDETLPYPEFNTMKETNGGDNGPHILCCDAFPRGRDTFSCLLRYITPKFLSIVKQRTINKIPLILDPVTNVVIQIENGLGSKWQIENLNFHHFHFFGKNTPPLQPNHAASFDDFGILPSSSRLDAPDINISGSNPDDIGRANSSRESILACESTLSPALHTLN